MNLPNRLTIGRIILSILIMILLVVPWYELGIKDPTFLFAGKVIVNLKYIIAGVLFLIAALTDFFDGYIARSQNMVTDTGKVLDAIADKILVNGLLIILAYEGFISIVIPVIIITRDTIVDALKMASGNKGKVIAASFAGKAKTMVMMIGLTFMLFYNLPFELIGIKVDYALVIIATVLSVVSGVEYYFNIKKTIAE